MPIDRRDFLKYSGLAVLGGAGADPQRVVRLSVRRGGGRGVRAGDASGGHTGAAEYGQAAVFEEIASIDRHGLAFLAVGGLEQFDEVACRV